MTATEAGESYQESQHIASTVCTQLCERGWGDSEPCLPTFEELNSDNKIQMEV